MSGLPEYGPGIRAAPRRETVGIVLGSVVAAAAAYGFLQIGARALGPERFAPISSLWTIQFLVLAVALMPVEQLATRSRTSGGERPTRSAWILAVTSAALALGFGLLNRESLYNGSYSFVLLTALAILTTAVYSFGRGLLAGDEEYARYGQVTGWHSLVRMAVGAPLLVITAQPVLGGWAIALAPLVVLFWRPFRETGNSSGSTQRAAPFLVGLLVGNALAQVILLGGPLLVGWLGGTATEMSLTFVVLTLFRAPVAVAAEIMARFLPPFTRLANEGRYEEVRRAARWIAVVGSILAGIAALLGAWVGAPITAFLFGSEFRPTSDVAMWVAAGSVLATVGLALNQALTGAGRTLLIAATWGAATVAFALGIAFVGGQSVTRVVTAFALAEAVAVLSLVVAIFRATAAPAHISHGTAS